MGMSHRIAPADLHAKRLLYRQGAKPEMNIRNAFAGMAVAPVHLRIQPPAVREEQGGGGSDGRPIGPIGSWMSGPDGCIDCCGSSLRYRQPQMQPQEGA